MKRAVLTNKKGIEQTILLLILGGITITFVFTGILLAFQNIACFAGVNWSQRTALGPNIGSFLQGELELDAQVIILNKTESCYEKAYVPSIDPEDPNYLELVSKRSQTCIALSECLSGCPAQVDPAVCETGCNADPAYLCLQGCSVRHPGGVPGDSDFDDCQNYCNVDYTPSTCTPAVKCKDYIDTASGNYTCKQQCDSELFTLNVSPESQYLTFRADVTVKPTSPTKVQLEITEIEPDVIDAVTGNPRTRIFQVLESPTELRTSGQVYSFAVQELEIDPNTSRTCHYDVLATPTDSSTAFSSKMHFEPGFCTLFRQADINVSVTGYGFNTVNGTFDSNVSITGKDVFKYCPSATVNFGTYNTKGDPMYPIFECGKAIKTKKDVWLDGYMFRTALTVNNDIMNFSTTADGFNQEFKDNRNAILINATINFSQAKLPSYITHNMTSCEDEIAVTLADEERALKTFVARNVTNADGICEEAEIWFLYDKSNETGTLTDAVLKKGESENFFVYFDINYSEPDPPVARVFADEADLIDKFPTFTFTSDHYFNDSINRTTGLFFENITFLNTSNLKLDNLLKNLGIDNRWLHLGLGNCLPSDADCGDGICTGNENLFEADADFCPEDCFNLHDNICSNINSTGDPLIDIATGSLIENRLTAVSGCHPEGDGFCDLPYENSTTSPEDCHCPKHTASDYNTYLQLTSPDLFTYYSPPFPGTDFDVKGDGTCDILSAIQNESDPNSAWFCPEDCASAGAIPCYGCCYNPSTMPFLSCPATELPNCVFDTALTDNVIDNNCLNLDWFNGTDIVTCSDNQTCIDICEAQRDTVCREQSYIDSLPLVLTSCGAKCTNPEGCACDPSMGCTFNATEYGFDCEGVAVSCGEPGGPCCAVDPACGVDLTCTYNPFTPSLDQCMPENSDLFGLLDCTATCWEDAGCNCLEASCTYESASYGYDCNGTVGACGQAGQACCNNGAGFSCDGDLVCNLNDAQPSNNVCETALVTPPPEAATCTDVCTEATGCSCPAGCSYETTQLDYDCDGNFYGCAGNIDVSTTFNCIGSSTADIFAIILGLTPGCETYTATVNFTNNSNTYECTDNINSTGEGSCQIIATENLDYNVEARIDIDQDGSYTGPGETTTGTMGVCDCSSSGACTVTANECVGVPGDCSGCDSSETCTNNNVGGNVNCGSAGECTGSNIENNMNCQSATTCTGSNIEDNMNCGSATTCTGSNIEDNMNCGSATTCTGNDIDNNFNCGSGVDCTGVSIDDNAYCGSGICILDNVDGIVYCKSATTCTVTNSDTVHCDSAGTCDCGGATNCYADASPNVIP